MSATVFLVGALMLSVGFNMIFIGTINKYHNITNNTPVSNQELKQMMTEIDRLSTQEYTNHKKNNTKYDIKTKEPIESFYIE
jgi:hypothetical protein